ncbi:hypothetical protein Scep_006974 [Stephania cephalantha]|uniref:Uncharacterized protein n=1 Tax=Stephania cephalantha TaxID=152367 RepID=A0AAP0KBJ3_9MAGN
MEFRVEPYDPDLESQLEKHLGKEDNYYMSIFIGWAHMNILFGTFCELDRFTIEGIIPIFVRGVLGVL